MTDTAKTKISILTTGDRVIYKKQLNGWKDPLFIRKNEEGRFSFLPVAEFNQPGIIVDPPKDINVLFSYDAEKMIEDAMQDYLTKLKAALKSEQA